MAEGERHDDGHVELRPHFAEQLRGIHAGLVELGDLVLANIRFAATTVLENRLDDVDALISADEPINELYAQLETEVFRILALQQPVASDLRYLVIATRTLYEMERSGDLAVNIGKQMVRIDGIPADLVLHSILERLVDAASAMFARGVEALASDDPQIGLVAEQEDERTDRLTAELFAAVTARQQDLGLEASVALFYIGRFFERIADHGVNIAQNVTFAVTGRFPEDA